MTPYLLVEIFVFVVVAAVQNKKALLHKSGFALAGAALVVFAGIRSLTVGSDSFNYVLKFTKINDIYDVLEEKVEPGYAFLCLLAKAVANNYWAVFTLAALIIVLCYFHAIRKHSVDPTISIFVYITSGVYTFLFNGARQAIAIAIVFLAIGAIVKRKFFVLAVCVAVAFFFHRTALVLLPAYFIVTNRNTRRTYVLVALLMIVLFLNFSRLISWTEIIDERYSAYSTYERGLGAGIALLNIGLFLLLNVLKRRIRTHREAYVVYMNMFLIGIGISAVSILKGLGASGVMRLSLYFNCALIMIWPIVFENIALKKDKILATYAFVLLYTFYFLYATSRFGELVPYEINPSLT